jgi:hypothetical protein
MIFPIMMMRCRSICRSPGGLKWAAKRGDGGGSEKQAAANAGRARCAIHDSSEVRMEGDRFAILG